MTVNVKVACWRDIIGECLLDCSVFVERKGRSDDWSQIRWGVMDVKEKNLQEKSYFTHDARKTKRREVLLYIKCTNLGHKHKKYY